jgi:hypothetical protein
VLATENKVKADNLELSWNDLKQNDLVNTKTTELSKFPIDMSTFKKQLQNNLKLYIMRN